MKKLSRKESVWQGVIQKIIESSEYLLDDSDEKHIKEFIMSQYCRTKKIQEYAEKNLRKLAKEVGKKIKDLKDYDLKLPPSEMLEYSDKLVEKIRDLDITIIEFKTENKLITSDMPVIVLNPFCFNGGGLIE